MSDGRNVIPNREASVERLLGAVSTVSDVSLEQALDTDTREQYEALAEKKVLANQPIYVKVFKVMGAVAACFFVVLMSLSGASSDGTGDFTGNMSSNDGNPLGDSALEEIIYRVSYEDMWYQSVTNEALLQKYGLPETVTDDMKGSMVTYLARNEKYEYYEVGHMTNLYLYACKDRQDVYILHDRNKALWVFVVPVED